MERPKLILLDTCVLINFLAVDRVGLLGVHSQYDFLITDHVRSEVTDYSPEQLQRLDLALSSGHIEETKVDAIEELAIFEQLISEKKLGIGECSAIAAAAARNIILAIDDKQAVKRAGVLSPSLKLWNTESLMVDFIQRDMLSVDQADEIKAKWESEHSFRLMFSSFRQLL